MAVVDAARRRRLGRELQGRSITSSDHEHPRRLASEIEPIPCLRGLGWEYDGLPEGDNVVILDAYNAGNEATMEGAPR